MKALPITFSAVLILGCSLFEPGEKGIEYSPGLPSIAQEFDQPRWSPDGTRILYFSAGHLSNRTTSRDSAGLYVARSDGTNRIQFAADVVSIQGNWSPDGLKIVYVFFGDIHTINLLDGAPHHDSVVRLTTTGVNFNPVWSPDGNWIAFDKILADASGPPGVWLTNTDGSTQHFVTNGSFPEWHPTQHKLYILRRPPGSHLEMYVHLVDIQTNNVDETYSFRRKIDLFSTRHSPTRSELLLESNAMLIYDFTTKSEKNLGRGITPDWSPDGNRIIFVNGHLMVNDRNGGNEIILLRHPHID